MDATGCVLQPKTSTCNISQSVSNSKFSSSDLSCLKLNSVNCDSAQAERCGEITKKDGQNCLVEKMSECLQNVSGPLDIRSSSSERSSGQMLSIYEILKYHIAQRIIKEKL